MPDPHEIWLGLDRMQQALAILKIQPKVPIVTVGGTNGKGSTTALITHLACQAGLKVGTYTSPHLHRVTERIQVNAQEIPEAYFIQALAQLEASLDLELSYFEYLTLLAFQYFEAENCDLWVLEVGLGGRLDAVNVLDADVAVITSIDWDHQEYLGSTLEAIALEKAGIARVGKPVLVGQDAQKGGLVDCLKRRGAQVRVEGLDFDSGERPSVMLLPAVYLDTHWALAQEALRCLTIAFPQSLQAIPALSGRFEVLAPLGWGRWVFDVAHNAESAHLLATRLKAFLNQAPPSKVVAIWHSLTDKDHEALVSGLILQVAAWIISPLDPGVTPRASAPEALRDSLSTFEGVGSIAVAASPADAFFRASEYAREGHTVLVFGGFNIVDSIRSLLFNTCYMDK